MEFSFEKVYNRFAKPLEGAVLEFPFGPFLFLLRDSMTDKPAGTLFPISLVLGLMAKPGGNEALDAFIAETLKDKDDGVCVVFVHEGHVKQIDDATTDEQVEALKDRGLQNDPNARLTAMIRIFHKSGVAAGFCPMDADRRAKYAPISPDEKFIHVKVGADQTPPTDCKRTEE